ncbi:hypothetical protein [Amycolatopsis sp. CA-230715]|uniref:hypothetical protein n=1 Tax=Amycolatopsis sp. CA-230715 TaxID=2745196 RepID=UPI001C33029F|nr:hypothetical protein [Amycolatopsis sp. CA-230715]QWF84965.1 hypothetical protein HUW46_08417 [Amycolatopsis sp. CA-230715]
MAPGSLTLADHPKTVNLREGMVVEALSGWLHELFHPDNRDRTAAALLGSDGNQAGGALDAVRNRLADAEARLQRYQAAIAAGVEPEALVDPSNQAQAERATAKAQIESLPAGTSVSTAEVYARIDQLGDVCGTLADGTTAGLSRLYRALNLELRYEPKELAVYVTTSPGVDSACVRGAVHTIHTPPCGMTSDRTAEARDVSPSCHATCGAGLRSATRTVGEQDAAFVERARGRTDGRN